MNTSQLEARIYIACLAAYNHGILYGKWIDANQSTSELQEAIHEILADSPIGGAEEWAIHDYEGFGDINIGENESLSHISELADLMMEHGELGALVYGYYNNIKDAKHKLEYCYIGAYGSKADFARELTEETQEVPQNLAYYIDYESMARDMDYSGDIDCFYLDGKQHIFWGH